MNDRREKNMEKRKEKLKELGIKIEPTKPVLFAINLNCFFFFQFLIANLFEFEGKNRRENSFAEIEKIEKSSQ